MRKLTWDSGFKGKKIKRMTAKFERLHQLAQYVNFSALIPPLVALPADEALAITEVSPQADCYAPSIASILPRSTIGLNR
ncbi:hypothetical protein C5471_00160 [Photorhabdus tasmaniensis]|uniref:Uncharacterized protein n=3 Tax=Photorhabdus tasmaniensis TaxID=1004159 RepID=A0ABX0GD06_9GAMM|nr:hypothetical protein [Photorhabdus tasmaniensis]